MTPTIWPPKKPDESIFRKVFNFCQDKIAVKIGCFHAQILRPIQVFGRSEYRSLKETAQKFALRKKGYIFVFQTTIYIKFKQVEIILTLSDLKTDRE